MQFHKSALTVVMLTLLAGSPALASSMASSPRPMPRPVDLVLPVKALPCAIILTDTRTGTQWYDDGTLASTGRLPAPQYTSALEAWAFIETTAIHSPSAEGITMTPVCFTP